MGPVEDHGPGGIHRFEVGDFRCAAINDGTFFYTAAQYFADAPPDALASALSAHGLDADRVPSPYTCLLIETGDDVVVVDTGADRAALAQIAAPGADAGHWAEGFARTRVDPADVGHVIITHAHPDHIGGNTDASGDPRFPNARVLLWRAEWEHWTSESTLAAQPPVFAEPVRRQLLPLRDRVELLDRDGAVVPGISVIHAPGHTPGHIAVAVHSRGEELLYVSDAALHPLHLEHPDWSTVFELDRGQALESRRMLFDRAAATRALVLAFHFDPFPSLGHIHAVGTGWTWEPVPRSA